MAQGIIQLQEHYTTYTILAHHSMPLSMSTIAHTRKLFALCMYLSTTCRWHMLHIQSGAECLYQPGLKPSATMPSNGHKHKLMRKPTHKRVHTLLTRKISKAYVPSMLVTPSAPVDTRANILMLMRCTHNVIDTRTMRGAETIPYILNRHAEQAGMPTRENAILYCLHIQHTLQCKTNYSMPKL